MIPPAMGKTKAQNFNQLDDGIRWRAHGAGAPSRACTSSILERVLKTGGGEDKTSRGHMVADTISTCVAAAVFQAGGYIVVRVGAKQGWQVNFI